jgi:S-adenosylmethionine-diacylglycerol 3-amino-3-carboxypropyl transferase
LTINNTLQFAVVREDPLIDIRLTKLFNANKVLLVASGGCTALSLAVSDPSMDIHVFDPNPRQIEHVKQKTLSLEQLTGTNNIDLFNVDGGDDNGLSESGNFEILFRNFRTFIKEHVADDNSLSLCFSGDDTELDKIMTNKYWPIAFELFFNDNYLEAMFGPLALQHAPSNSYAQYFKSCIEQGLLCSDRSTNYFLHHIFFGRYFNRPECLPLYLSSPSTTHNLTYIEGYLSYVERLSSFDYVMLSNIFDWMDDTDVNSHIALLRNMKPGALLVYRQLNNDRDLTVKLSPYFEHKETLSKELFKLDRSLFYSRLVIAVRK